MSHESTGTLLQIGATSITEITGIDDVGIENSTTENTNLSSTAASFVSNKLIRGGEIPVSGFFNPADTAGQKAMYDLVASGASQAFTVSWVAAGTDYTFNAIVTAFKIGAAVEGLLTFTATLQVTGTPSLGISASTGLSALSLTGAGGAISPAFGAAVRYYTFGGVTATSVTVTPTAATHTIKLYVDGTYVQDIISGQASAAISVTINVGKKLTLVAYQAGKAQQITEIIVVKTA